MSPVIVWYRERERVVETESAPKVAQRACNVTETVSRKEKGIEPLTDTLTLEDHLARLAKVTSVQL